MNLTIPVKGLRKGKYCGKCEYFDGRLLDNYGFPDVCILFNSSEHYNMVLERDKHDDEKVLRCKQCLEAEKRNK